MFYLFSRKSLGRKQHALFTLRGFVTFSLFGGLFAF